MPFGCHVSTSVTSLEWRHSWCGIFTFTFSVLVTTDHDCAIQDDVTDCIPLLWHFLSKVDVIFNQIDSLWFKTFQCSPQRYSFKVSSKLFTTFYKYHLYSDEKWEKNRKMKKYFWPGWLLSRWNTGWTLIPLNKLTCGQFQISAFHISFDLSEDRIHGWNTARSGRAITVK